MIIGVVNAIDAREVLKFLLSPESRLSIASICSIGKRHQLESTAQFPESNQTLPVSSTIKRSNKHSKSERPTKDQVRTFDRS